MSGSRFGFQAIMSRFYRSSTAAKIANQIFRRLACHILQVRVIVEKVFVHELADARARDEKYVERHGPVIVDGEQVLLVGQLCTQGGIREVAFHPAVCT